jgi:hypothetical protein
MELAEATSQLFFRLHQIKHQLLYPVTNKQLPCMHICNAVRSILVE